MSESPEVTQPPEAPLLDRLRELDRRITGSVERAVRELHLELGERVRRSHQELLRWVEEHKPEIPSSFLVADDLAPLTAQASTSAGRRAVHELLEAVGKIDASTTQADVLATLLEEAHRFSSRTAFFLTRASSARGWASRGFGSDTAIEAVEVETGGLAALEQLRQGHGPVAVGGADRTALAHWLGAPAASEAVMIPFVLRGRLGGALYADRLDGEGLDVESLQLLTHNAALALETLAVRAPGVSPVLRTGRSQESAAAHLETWEPGVLATAPVATAGVVAPSAAAAVVAAAEPAAFEVEAVDLDAETGVMATADEVAAEEIAPAEEPYHESEPVFEAPVFETPAAVAPEVEAEAPAFAEIEAVTEAAEPVPAYVGVAAEPAIPEVDLFEPAAAPVHAVAEPEPELEDYGVAELEDYGITTERPTPEVAPETDLWPAEDEEMPAVDFSPPSAEVSSIESVPMELADDMPAIAYPDFPVGQQTVRLDVSAFQTPAPPARVAPVGSEDPTLFRSTAEVPTWEVEEPAAAVESVDYELEAETTPYEPITEAVPTTAPRVASEDPTILGSRASLGIELPPPAPPPVAPAPPIPRPVVAPSPIAEPEPESAGSTQVQPPSDVRGPGLAFAAGGGAAGHEALHEEARRLARLLVSEIKLYNEEIIEEGKREGNIYNRLREDVDRSRQMYEERIDPRIRGSEDYFYQELVQRLAGGDPRLLGM